MIRIKRVYIPPEPADGERYLVDRLWPRGMKKEAAQLTVWLKEIAPSPGLHKWYGHRPERWPEFRRRYQGELKDAPQRAALETLRQAARRGPVTLVYASRDEERNNACVVQRLLEKTSHG